MRFADLVGVSRSLAATSSRRDKVGILAEAIRGLTRQEVPAGVMLLAGEPRQRQTGVGWMGAMAATAPPASQATLGVLDVDAVLQELADSGGAGSQGTRRERLTALLALMTGDEQEHLRALLAGGVRQGALRSLVADALAVAAGVPPAAVQRALMFGGDLGQVAGVALAEGAGGLSGMGLRVGTPLLPMLASPASDPEAAITGFTRAAAEWKLDGVRIQVHRDGGEVGVFTRSLDEVTGRVPEVVAAALALPVDACVLDGEVIALRGDGRPERFQVTGARLATRDARAGAVPLTPVLFDVLHLDGADLLDLPGGERVAALHRVVPPGLVMPHTPVDSPDAVRDVLARALAAGHEGVVVKDLGTPYAAGRRGAAWRKLKPVHTLDLVVLAAEWGGGRRTGRLSNLHLGARDEVTGGFVMLGKTFKGLTDAMLAWQTEWLLAREVGRQRGVVRVRPELVVEVAFDGVQTSRRYPGGVTLRFARVVRHRPDRSADAADTIQTVRAMHAAAGAEGE